MKEGALANLNAQGQNSNFTGANAGINAYYLYNKKDNIKSILKALKLGKDDFLSKKVLALSLAPFIISSISFLLLLGYFANSGQSSISKWLLSFNFITSSAFLSGVVENILNYVFLTAFYVIGVFFALTVSMAVAGVVAGFFTPVISGDINAKYYQKAISKSVGNFALVKIYALTLLKFGLLFLCCVGLFFVPVLNLVAFNIAFFYLFYKFMYIDVCSTCADESEFYALMHIGSTFGFKITAFIFYLLCLLPFVGLFLQLYFVSVFSHLIFTRLEK